MTCRKAALKAIVESFYIGWSLPEFVDLLFDAMLEILQCDELVVRSELEAFLAVIH